MKTTLVTAAYHSEAAASLPSPEVLVRRPSKCQFDDCENAAKIKGKCQKHYNRERYLRDAEAIKERVRVYRINNSEKIRAAWDKWEAENPEKHKESHRKSRIANRPRIAQRKALWVSKNRERVNSAAVKLRAKNPEKHRAMARIRYRRNPEKHREASKKCYHKNPSKWLARHKRWAKQNPDKYRQSVRNSVRKRLGRDVGLQIRMLLSRRILRAVRAQYSDKAFKTMEVLGCSIAEFKAFIESKFTMGMNWGNWGLRKDQWQLDHIIPCAKFDLTKPVHQRRCFHFSNYQPLWTEHNRDKSDKLINGGQFQLL